MNVEYSSGAASKYLHRVSAILRDNTVEISLHPLRAQNQVQDTIDWFLSKTPFDVAHITMTMTHALGLLEIRLAVPLNRHSARPGVEAVPMPWCFCFCIPFLGVNNV